MSGTHCHHWWDADPDSPRGTACHYCGDDTVAGDDGFSEHCPDDPEGDS